MQCNDDRGSLKSKNRLHVIHLWQSITVCHVCRRDWVFLKDQSSFNVVDTLLGTVWFRAICLISIFSLKRRCYPRLSTSYSFTHHSAFVCLKVNKRASQDRRHEKDHTGLGKYRTSRKRKRVLNWQSVKLKKKRNNVSTSTPVWNLK